MPIDKCDPNKFICSVEQWFDEFRQQQVSALLAESKPIYSKDLEVRIDRAVDVLAGKQVVRPSFTYGDLFNAKADIDYWETVSEVHPGMYSREFIANRVYATRRLHGSLLRAENELFRSAVREGRVLPTYKGVVSRIAHDILYDVGVDILDVVRLFLGGKSVGEIRKQHPEIKDKDISAVINIIEKHK